MSDNNDDLKVRTDATNQPYYLDSSKTKPTGKPDTEKNFKKVYDKEAKASVKKSVDDEGEETADSISDEEGEGCQGGNQGKVFSLFSTPKENKLGNQQFSQADKSPDSQLAMGQVKSPPTPFPDETVNSPVKDNPPKGSIFQTQIPTKTISNPVAQNEVPVKTTERPTGRVPGENIAKSKVKGESKTDSSTTTTKAGESKGNAPIGRLSADAEESETSAGGEGERSFAKNANANPFVREQVDITAVPQSSIVAQELTVNATSKKAPMAPSATVSALVEQMIKELSVMSTDGKTETSILLRHPPMLDGAQLILTGFDSARGEINIKFANLTQQAQALITQQQHSLMSALETKGYQVHIFVATTVMEPQIITAEGQSAEKERQQQQGENQQQGQRPFKDERNS